MTSDGWYFVAVCVWGLCFIALMWWLDRRPPSI